jgi:hypothetical protein
VTGVPDADKQVIVAGWWPTEILLIETGSYSQRDQILILKNGSTYSVAVYYTHFGSRTTHSVKSAPLDAELAKAVSQRIEIAVHEARVEPDHKQSVTPTHIFEPGMLFTANGENACSTSEQTDSPGGRLVHVMQTLAEMANVHSARKRARIAAVATSEMKQLEALANTPATTEVSGSTRP